MESHGQAGARRDQPAAGQEGKIIGPGQGPQTASGVKNTPQRFTLPKKSLHLFDLFTTKTCKMKKFRLFLSCLGILSLTAFAACTNDKAENDEGGGNDTPGGGGDTEVVTPTKGVTTDAYYKADHYGAGTGNLWINFTSDMKLDPDLGEYIGPGYVLCLDFNTALAENADFAKLAEGTYTSGETDTHAAFTLNVADGDSYLTRYDADGTPDMLEIVAGSVVVTIEQDYYHLECSLMLEDGTPYPYSFIGKLTFINRSSEGKMSNLTENVAVTGLTQALLAYNGKAFTAESDLYFILLAGPDYNLEINYGESDALMISVNVPPGSSDGIPSGTYTMIDAATAKEYPVGTALSGVFDSTYGAYYGTWYFSTQNKLESSIQGGEVTVTNSGNDTYTIKFSLRDGYGHKVEGSYSGVCGVEDWS